MEKDFFVSVVTEIATIRTEQQRRFEQNERFEEMTDLAERIGFPIETDIYYELRGESLYAMSDTKSRAFIEQTYQSKQEAQYLFTGDQSFEVVRRSHEHDEAIDTERLAKGELGGNVMIKVSKVPDAIVYGTTSIKGYKRETMRTFIRMYNREGSMVRCKLFSIDQNNHDGLQRIGKLIGIQLTDRSSEDILADSIVVDVDDADQFVNEMSEALLKTYDDTMYEQTGKRTRGGSHFSTELDAQSAVESQPHLLREHFDAISAIAGLGLNPAAHEDLLEIERQKTAAAISLSARGQFVSSTGDGSVAAEVAQGNYSRECPTSSENAMQQGEADLMKDWIKVIEKCPKCGDTKVLASKHGEIISGACGCHLNVCTGEYWKEEIPKKTTPKEIVAVSQQTEKRINKHDLIRHLYGEKAVLYTRGTIGGASYDIKEKDTGTTIDTLTDLSKLHDLVT